MVTIKISAKLFGKDWTKNIYLSIRYLWVSFGFKDYGILISTRKVYKLNYLHPLENTIGTYLLVSDTVIENYYN